MTARRIPVQYPNRRAALASYRTEGQRLSLFVPTRSAGEVGDIALVQVTFGDCEQCFELKGHVRWRRGEARGIGQEIGLGIGFEGEEKLPLAAMVAFCAGRPLSAGTAGKDRFPVHIPCRIKTPRRSIKGEISDVSASGMYVAAPVTHRRVKPGVELDVQIDPKLLGLLGDWLTVKVVWLGEKQGRWGFGARFSGPASVYMPIIKKYLVAASP